MKLGGVRGGRGGVRGMVSRGGIAHRRGLGLGMTVTLSSYRNRPVQSVEPARILHSPYLLSPCAWLSFSSSQCTPLQT